MGFFKSIQKAVSSVAKATKWIDPIGSAVVLNDIKNSNKINTLLFGSSTPSGSYDDLGGTATTSVAQSDEAMQSAKTKKTNDAKQRRQGFSGGSTLLTTTEDETQQLNKNTLLGM